MPFDPAWSSARKILCVRLDSMGDVLMTTPAMRALKERLPGSRLTLLTSPAGAALSPLLPEVDETLVYQAPWMKSTPPRPDSRPEYRFAARLRRMGFDAAVIFTVFSQNPLPAAFLAYLAGIPLRLAHCRENPYQLLTHWVRDPDREGDLRHEVQRQLDLVRSIGARPGHERLSLKIPWEARRKVDLLLEELGLDAGRPWALIHPGASAPSRRYPPQGFAWAADLLIESRLEVVFSGGSGECALVEEIRGQMSQRAHSLAGQLDLPLLAALIARAPLLISNNSGPAHLAAAAGTPVVDLYALTNPQHTPWMTPQRVLNHDVPCKYCYASLCPVGHHHCLSLVRPEEVAAAALELLAECGHPVKPEAYPREARRIRGLHPAPPVTKEVEKVKPDRETR